jgi:hypothetical protein
LAWLRSASKESKTFCQLEDKGCWDMKIFVKSNYWRIWTGKQNKNWLHFPTKPKNNLNKDTKNWKRYNLVHFLCLTVWPTKKDSDSINWKRGQICKESI